MVNDPNESGIVPLNLLLDKYNAVSFVKDLMDNGIVPVSWLSVKSIDVKIVKVPNLDGIFGELVELKIVALVESH